MSKPLHILITRPAQKARGLADFLEKTLNTQSLTSPLVRCTTLPLFDYQPLASSSSMQQQVLEQPSTFYIFVSAAAVTFANDRYPLKQWHLFENKNTHIFAVGKATQKALQALGFNHSICPEQENSEGLLALPQLQNIEQKNITIVRGNGGREHLNEHLSARGAKVSYIESYQRVWRTFAKNIAQQWQQQQINCIVVTSNDLLKKIVQLIQQNNSTPNNTIAQYWQKECLWIVASERIADSAKYFGLENVINANGANELALSGAIKQAQITLDPRMG